MAIQRIAGGSWCKFQDMMNTAYPRFGHTLAITFEEADQQEHEEKLDTSFDPQLKGLLSVPPPPKDEEPDEEEPEGEKPKPAPKRPRKK